MKRRPVPLSVPAFQVNVDVAVNVPEPDNSPPLKVKLATSRLSLSSIVLLPLGTVTLSPGPGIPAGDQLAGSCHEEDTVPFHVKSAAINVEIAKWQAMNILLKACVVMVCCDRP